MERPHPLRASLLVVEDNPGEARLLQRLLDRREPSAFAITHVSLLEDALRKVAELPVDLILLDLFLPDSSGLETLVRMQRAAPQVPTIVLTGMDDEEFATQAVRAGAQDYVVKGKTGDGQLERAIRYAIERKRIEEELRKLTRAVDQSPVSILITTTEGVIEYVNPRFEQVSGYTRAEAIGNTPRILRSGHTPPAAYREMWQAILAGREWRGEICNRKKTGELYWETVSISPIRNSAGTVTHFVGIKEDITDRKNSEAQMLRAQKMESIQSVLDTIAQNFNNILNNILGFSLLVKKYAGDPTKVARYSDVIEQSAGRGAQLTDRLLALSRTEHGSMNEVRPEDVIRDAIGLLPPTAPNDVSLQIDVASDVHTLLADRGDLAAAIGHILRNAVESIGERSGGGTILLRVGNAGPEDKDFPFSGEARSAPWVGVHIADSGAGIAPEIRDRIFEPLFTTKDHSQHAGLGLANVYNTIRRHRGVVTAQSDVGQGAVFHLYLPAYVPSSAEKLDSPLSGKGEVVMLVDDEPAMREFGKELLSEYGYNVLLATNGEEALELFKGNAGGVDLVILDLVMPKMDGGQTFLEMKKIRNDIRVCFCTGYTSDQVITSLLEEENLKAIKKPFQAQEFLSMVRQVIEDR